MADRSSTPTSKTRDPLVYPNLSLPLSQLKPEYEVVVVGSGYGAGVAASRMARAGKSVAILEVGKEWRAGSFPHSLNGCLRELNVSGSRLIRPSTRKRLFNRLVAEDETKLFQLRLGEGQHAFCAHGLGGGSLINAGVFLEATAETMEMSAWPEEIRTNPACLDKYYARASAMLQPNLYPISKSSPALPKTKHLQEAASWLGKESNFSLTPLTTSFTTGRNSTGVLLQANQDSGHESTGLNDGSKNSLPVTYLADAWNGGAEIFCGCQVKYVEEGFHSSTEGGKKGYTVYFSPRDKGRGSFTQGEDTLFWVRAKEFCFLGAGALGTTEIILRSKQHGLGVSPMVGRNMSGNGDLLVFGYSGTKDINGIASPSSKIKPGPTITSMIDLRHEKNQAQNPLAGYIIEDGCLPEPFAPVIQMLLATQAFPIRSLLSGFIHDPPLEIRRAYAALKSIIRGPYAPGSAIQRTATYLVMSHDSNEITMTLEGNRPRLRGVGEGRAQNVRQIIGALEGLIRRSGARMGYSYFYGRRQEEVSVHALGGANMSRDGTGREGATNHMGQVFTGSGREVHSGLFCCDASVIPTSLGVNPLATITAVAERSVALLADERKMNIDFTTQNGQIDFDSKPRISHFEDNGIRQQNRAEYVPTRWCFTEALEGYISAESRAMNFEVSGREGKVSSSAMKMVLAVEIQRRVRGSGPTYKGLCTGTVSCAAISQRPMRVMQGELDFFVSGEDSVDATSLTYTLPLQTVDSLNLTLVGRKTISSSCAFSISRLWSATTTVNVKVENSKGGGIIGAGVLRIPISSFPRQMRSFQRTDQSAHAAIGVVIIFLLYFIFQLAVVFFHPLIPRWSGPSRDSSRVFKTKQPSAVQEISTSDGVKVKLDIYHPVEADKDNPHSPPILFLPGITGINAEHSIYTLPFQQTNMVQYFTSRGHRCYVLTPRWSHEEHIAKHCTVFDSRLDVAAALAHIATHEQHSPNPYIIAHCQGSVSLAMAMLTGTVKATQILGITANSVFMNQVFGRWNAVKASSPLLIRLYEYLDGPYFPISFVDRRKDIVQWILDRLLSFYPVPRRDRCTSAACHRSSFAFGLLWNHQNLDRAIHDNVDGFFAGTHTKCLEHITRMGSRGSCLDNELNSLLTSNSLENLRGVPILFMSGSDNEVFQPEGTLRDYELLRRRFGERMYRRFVPEGYGHLDTIVGKRADRDVYWKVEGHLGWCVQNDIQIRGEQKKEEKGLMNGMNGASIK
ncbi:uncharacterized protein BDV17DRAFT_57214 [Aspergillus undulatus]|uniref:uncharacterized protein n=1 Tax=Aspergillus undulatus TaxID=1810928 RepID=UPI003CCE013E